MSDTIPFSPSEIVIPNMATWENQVAMSFEESRWDDLSDDARHLAITERIGQPLRVKLLYDSYLWKQLLDQNRVQDASEVAELLPGWSHTIPVALESSGFSGELTQVDLEQPAALTTPFPYQRTWLPRDIFKPLPELADAAYILGNHITDDILICQAEATDSERQHYYSSPNLSHDIWEKLADDPLLDHYIAEAGACMRAIATALNPGQTLILREYPSTTTTVQHDATRWELERAVQTHVFNELEGMPNMQTSRPDLSHMPVPPGSRFPGSVIEVTKPAVSN